jgi:hypothetical protein
MVNSMKWLRVVLLLVFMEAGSSLPALAETPCLRFIKPVDLPSLGLRVNLMPDSCEMPPFSPQIFLYSAVGGNEKRKEERYQPADLWWHTQQAGRWTGRYENNLVLIRMTHRLPKGFKDPHVTREVYQERVSGAGAVGGLVQSQDDVRGWMADYTGNRAITGEKVERLSARVDPIIRFCLGPADPYRVAYAFRLNRNAEGTSPATWIAAIFEVSPKIPMETAMRSVEKEFVASLSFLTIMQPASVVSKSSSATVKGDAGKSDDLLIARKQAEESIRNMTGWWFLESSRYIVLSNLKGSSKLMVEQLDKAMGTIRVAYARCLSESQKNSVCVIRMPATPLEYKTYVGPNLEWTGGVWIPDRKEMLIRPVVEGSSQEKRRSLFRLAFHEGFHQYAFYAMDQAHASMWFNEGMAQFFENAVIVNGRIRIEEDPRALGRVKAVLEKGGFDLNSVFRISREQFYSTDPSEREDNYAMAWAVVYYLKKGFGGDASSPFAGLLENYATAMQVEGKTAEEATESMLKGVDIQRMSLDFRQFWHSLARQSVARRYDPFFP